MHFMRKFLMGICALVVFCSLRTASAQTLNSANGHYYQGVAVTGGITWTEAEAAARAMTYQGAPGHLVTITSDAELQFVVNTFPQALTYNYWLGGRQASGSVEPAGGWEWSNGEPWNYTAWNSGEPNNTEGSNSPDRTAFVGTGRWNDIGDSARLGGYLVEFEPPFVAQLTSVVLSTTAITGTVPFSGAVNISAAAPAGGAVIRLSQNTETATIPATVTIPQGKRTASFTIRTSAVSTPTALTITAAWNDNIVTDSVIVKPIGVQVLALCPGTMTSGQTITGVAVLDAPSSQPTVVTLRSSSSLVRVSSSFTISAGQVSRTFSVIAGQVTSRTRVTITSKVGEQERTVHLIVLPS